MIKGEIKFRYGDMFTVIRKNEKFDKIIFNPPYLPTKKEDKIGDTDWFDIATDGGPDGLEVTKKFINNLPRFLKRNSQAYFIFSSLSNRNKLHNLIKKAGLKKEIINTKYFENERLDVYQVSLQTRF